MIKELVVYESYVVPSKTKGGLPEVVYNYLADSLHNPSFSSNIHEAYRFYEIEEAKNTATLFDMEVGEIEINVRKVY